MVLFNYFFFLFGITQDQYLSKRCVCTVLIFLYFYLLLFPFFFFFFFFRLLKKEENFIFIPRSREELPENFPKEIPGICYFLEVRSGQKQPKSSITSARVRKVSYNIGTMFLRETSLWGLLQIKDSSKKHKPRTGSWQGSWRFFYFTALSWTSSKSFM